MKQFNQSLIGVLSILICLQNAVAKESVRALYGDPTTQSVVIIDVKKMQEIEAVPTAATPYPVDRAGPLVKAYAITRGAPSVDIIDPKTAKNTGSIPLEHNPRSGEAYNTTLGLQLIAGGNKPLSSLIDPFSDEVVATAGLNEVTTPNGDYGGGNASGHPFWFTARKFAVIDRANRKIQLYRVKGDRWRGFKTKLLAEVTTPTTVHHIIPRDLSNTTGKDQYIFYAVGEGAPARGIHPQLIELKVKGKKMKVKRILSLDAQDASIMGAHHADMHPDGKHIYMGSTEGNLYVINRKKMEVISAIPTGFGSGHTRFVPEKNLALITNHKDTFVSVINAKTHQLIKNVEVSPPQANGQILQSHTNYVDDKNKNYYAFATDHGEFFEIDLDKLVVKRTLYTGGTPRQGVFIKAKFKKHRHRHFPGDGHGHKNRFASYR